jgi:hypothetical protein
LLAERAKLVETWHDELEQHHIQLVRTSDLYLPDGLLDQLSERIAHNEIKRAREIEDELQDLDAARIVYRLHLLDAATVRRHEAQHGFDDARPVPLRYPAALADNLGPASPELEDDSSMQRHARQELAGYLSQVANDPLTPHLAVWNLAGHAFSKWSWGTPESYGAVIVLDGLARLLGGAAHEPIIHDGFIDRDRLAAIAAPIAAASDDKLRAAAASLWHELYGEPLISIVDPPGAIY